MVVAVESGVIPPPPPPPPPSGSGASNWRAKQQHIEQTERQEEPAQRREERVVINGAEVPRAIAGAFKETSKDKKPFTYLPGGRTDFSDKPNPSLVRSQQNATTTSSLNVNYPKVLPIVSGEREKAEMPVATHLQYNSPMSLYSANSAQEAYSQQTGNFLGPATAIAQQWNPGQPYSYRPLRHEEEQGKERSKTAHSARYDEPVADYPKYHGFVDPNLQSPSFKKIQYSAAAGGYDRRAPEQDYYGQAVNRGATGDPSYMFDGSQRVPTQAQHDPLLEGEQPLEPSLANKIAQAEMPHVPATQTPNWASAAQTKHDHWSRAADYDPIDTRQKPAPQWASRAPPQQEQQADKWQQYYGRQNLEHGGQPQLHHHHQHQQYPQQPVQQHYSSERQWPAPKDWYPQHSPRPQEQHRAPGYQFGGIDFAQEQQQKHYVARGAGQQVTPPGVKHHGPRSARAKSQEPYSSREHDDHYWLKLAVAPNIRTAGHGSVGETLSNQKMWREGDHYDHRTFGLYYGKGQEGSGWKRSHHHRHVALQRSASHEVNPNKYFTSGPYLPKKEHQYHLRHSYSTAEAKEMAPFGAPGSVDGSYLSQQNQRHYNYYGSGANMNVRRARPMSHHEAGPRKEVSITSLITGQAEKPGLIPEVVPEWQRTAEQKQNQWQSGRVDAAFQSRSVTRDSMPTWSQTAQRKRDMWEQKSSRMEPRGGQVAFQPPPFWAKKAQQTHTLWRTESERQGVDLQREFDPFAEQSLYHGHAHAHQQQPPQQHYQQRYDQQQQQRQQQHYQQQQDHYQQQQQQHYQQQQQQQHYQQQQDHYQQQQQHYQQQAQQDQQRQQDQQSSRHQQHQGHHHVTSSTAYTASKPSYQAGSAAGEESLAATAPLALALQQTQQDQDHHRPSSTKVQSTGEYRDADGRNVTYSKHSYTKSDGGKSVNMLTEEEKRVLDEPLQPGVISRHVTTKYYKKNTVSNATTTVEGGGRGPPKSTTYYGLQQQQQATPPQQRGLTYRPSERGVSEF